VARTALSSSRSLHWRKARANKSSKQSSKEKEPSLFSEFYQQYGNIQNKITWFLGASDTIEIVKWYTKCFIYWTADLKSSELWSSQLRTQFKQLRIEAWKRQDFNGVWTRDLAIPVSLFPVIVFSEGYVVLLSLLAWQHPGECWGVTDISIDYAPYWLTYFGGVVSFLFVLLCCPIVLFVYVFVTVRLCYVPVFL